MKGKGKTVQNTLFFSDVDGIVDWALDKLKILDRAPPEIWNSAQIPNNYIYSLSFHLFLHHLNTWVETTDESAA